MIRCLALSFTINALTVLFFDIAAATRPQFLFHEIMENNNQVSEISNKLADVVTVVDFFSLMARYNKAYCKESAIEVLKKYSKSTASKKKLTELKKYCSQPSTSHGIGRRDISGGSAVSVTLGQDAQEIDRILKQHRNKKIRCNPKKTVVKLYPPPHSIYIPECITVKKCSGCCENRLYTCSPVLENIVSVKRKVIQIKLVHEKNIKTTYNIKTVLVDQHTKCECNCQISSLNCTSVQTFDKNNCSCRCKNFYEQKYCNPPKYWNTANCQCECKYSQSCSSGFYPDNHSCKCLPHKSFHNFTNKSKKKGERRSNQRS